MRINKFIRTLSALLVSVLVLIACQKKDGAIYDKGVALIYAGKFTEAKAEFSALATLSCFINFCGVWAFNFNNKFTFCYLVLIQVKIL